MMRYHFRSIATALLVSLAPGTAWAQAEETLLVQPAIPLDYDRGRNISVVERTRPDYDPLGIRAGGFLIFPRLDVGLGATDNVFITDVGAVSDVYALLNPSVRVNSDWSRHQVSLATGARLRRYLDETLRNQEEWYVNALGRADLGSDYSLTGEAQIAQTQESPFSGETESNVAALSSFQRKTGILRGQYRAGRTRMVISYDYNDFDFDTIELTTGATVNQSDRNRTINRLTAQGEYALSPSIALYGQFSFGKTDYRRPLLPTTPRRDSDAYRFIGGVNIDMSGFLRGTLGVGYVSRKYDSPVFDNVDGFSAEGKLEYFPTELTTFTLGLRRVIEDSSLGGTSAFFDNRLSLRVDHELLRNLILNASTEYEQQDYFGSTRQNKIYRIRGGGRYLMTRTLGIQFDTSYGRRRTLDTVRNGSLHELRGEVSLVIQR